MQQLRNFAFLFSILTIIPKVTWACDNSEISLVSITDNGGSFDYVIQVCIGGGVLGVNTGADGPTRTFALALDAGGNTVVVSNVTPSITSIETMVTMNASVQGPQGPPFDADAIILYLNVDPDPFTCISSTAVCGEPYIDCNTISFTTDVELETITAFGIEGNGNSLAGCTGEPDMTIDILALPVEWAAFGARVEEEVVLLEWETTMESDNAYFTVERSVDGKVFRAIGRVEGNNTTTQVSKYQFLDQPVSNGRYYYRLKQVDYAGSFTYSSIVAAVVQQAKEQTLRVFPNPVVDRLHLSARRSYGASVIVEVYDQLGQLVEQGVYDWNGQLLLPTNHYRSGVYTLRLYADQQLLGQERFVKR